MLSPAYRQVLGGDSEWFPRWVMFHGFGRNVCDVTFFTVAEDGTRRERIDRFEVLGRSRSWSQNKSLVRMNEGGGGEGRTTPLSCEEPDTDLRVVARCGSRGKGGLGSTGAPISVTRGNRDAYPEEQ